MKSFRTVLLLGLVVLAVGGIALVQFFATRGDEMAEIPSALPPRDAAAPRPEPTVTLPEETKGGTFAGKVVNEAGEGLAGAGVMLVSFQSQDLPGLTDQDVLERQFDPTQVPVFEPRTVAEGRTQADGSFRLAADSNSVVGHVVAFHPGHMPEIVAVNRPKDGIVIVLQGAGRVIGHTIDKETGRPVPGVEVELRLQSKPVQTGPGAEKPLSQLAALQGFVTKVLGPRVWNVPFVGRPGLVLKSDSEGRFEFGPLGNAVQVEFVLTHPDYAWTEFDLKGEKVVRTVVEPGETVERTFALEKGKWIEGRVLDEQGNGVGQVRVAVEHVVQYYQHPEYRWRRRPAMTANDGTFRVAGLSHGPYLVVLMHPSFGTEHVPGVQENSRGNEFRVMSVGAIHGRVEGLSRKPSGVKIVATLESAEEDPKTSRFEEERFALDGQGEFTWRKIRPGKYRVWVRGSEMASQPQVVDIRPREQLFVTFALGGGGRILATIVDSDGRAVDPAGATLIQIGEGGREHPLGHFVTRAGVLDSESIVPGHYRLRINAAGFLPAESEPFDVVEGATASPERIVLRRQSFLRVMNVTDDRNRAVSVPVQLFLREGDAPEKALFLTQGNHPIRPGRVTVRALASDGRSFEKAYDVADGETVDVVIVVR